MLVVCIGSKRMVRPDPLRTTQPLPSERLYQPGPLPPPSTRQPASHATRRVMLWRWVRRGALLLGLVLILGAGLFVHRAIDFSGAISTAAPLSTALSATGRNSIVILGYGGPGHDGPYLTDSILVITQNPQNG